MRLPIRGNFPAFFLLPWLIAAFCCAAPALRGSQDVERDMKGFGEQTLRHEKAKRLLDRGREYLADDELELAREALSDALALHDELHEARFQLGRTEYADGNHNLALQHFRAIYERRPGFPGLKLELARCNLALGNCAQARLWLDRHLEKEETCEQTEKLRREIDKCSERQERRS